MRFINILLFSFLSVTPVSAQMPISNLSIADGLSNNSVNYIYKDHYGFMWFGTDDGLNKYDSYGFKVYKNNADDPSSLIHNRVVSMIEDQSGSLWVGTKKGLSIYDYRSSRFTTPTYHSKNSGKQEQIASIINTIKVDGTGNVFVGTSRLGLLIKKPFGQLEQVELMGKKGKSLSYSATAVAFHKGEAWVVIANEGLFTYNYKRGKLELKNPGISRANCMIASDSILWIGADGLLKYNIRTRTTTLQNKQPDELSGVRVMSLAFEGSKELWIATDGGGVNVLNLLTGKVRSITSGPERNTLTSNAVMSIYKDKENRTWLGTLRGGVNIIDGNKNKFTTISHSSFNWNSLISDFVLSFTEDENGNVWVGTDGRGISLWNRKTNSFRSITHTANRNSLSNNNVTSIIRDDDNTLWISTFGGGINRYDSKTNTFRRYPCISNNKEDKNVWKLYKDSKNNIWAGTCFGSDRTYRLNRKTGRFEPFSNTLKYVITFAEDKLGNLWMGTEYGQLVKVNLLNGTHKIYNLKYQVRAITPDRNGNLWVGVQYTGLYKFNPEKETFKLYTERHGLSNNSVLNIQEDNGGNLWLSTFNGISKFNCQSQKFTNYYESDGLQSNQFSFNASLKLSSGEILFGGIKGFNIFRPEEIKTNSCSPKVLITGIRINNIPIEQDEAFKDKQSVYSIKELSLPYDKAVISVDFAALQYSGSDKVSYSYYLEGWDNTWNTAGQSRTANYSRLREGEYVLRIKSTNSKGIWDGKERVLKLKVLPPWHRTWWAYLLYGIIGFFGIYCYNRYRVKQSQLRYEIQIANINTANERELNQKKISYFTNIAHEFRTPLTLIVNPIKEMLYSKGKSVEVNELSGVYRNTRRLLSLVDQLLLFNKAGSEQDRLKVVKFNIASLCHDIYLCFTNQARSKRIDFKFISESEEVEIYADREKIEIAIFNLISNAFKFTPAGGKIDFVIRESEREVEIRVRDTGRGIPAEIGNNLFEKFYQVNSEDTSLKSGFGIGLYLVNKFVTSHKGEVSYNSTVGEGTEFSIKLLKGKEYLNRAYIFENISETPLLVESLIESSKADLPLEEQGPSETSEINYLLSEQLSMLIVDDNIDIRNYVRKVFEHSYNILEAADGIEGLKAAQKYLPDIIISDVSMPGLDGIELCRKIKEDPTMNHIPIVLLTSATETEVKLKGIECGAADYITKPFDIELLTARVLNLLKSRKNLQQYFYNHITLRTDNLKISPEYKEFFNKCISIVEDNLLVTSFTAKTFSQELGMSYSNLYKKIKYISGKSINEFVRFIRLRKAAELLIKTDCNINEAAFEAGFNDIKYFREQFSKLFGMKPSEYVKKYRKSFQQSYKLNEQTIAVLEKVEG